MKSRKAIAFHSNVGHLLGRVGRLYFWTFTLPHKVPVKEARRMWHILLTILRREVPDWAGVRVFEMHSGRKIGFNINGVICGESHGMHVHFLATRFHDLQIVRRAAKACGWGRIHVVRVRDGEKQKVANYMAKYLSKDRPEALKGVRLVGYVGLGAQRCRYKDIEFFGLLKDLWSAARELPGWHQMKWHARCAAVHMLHVRCICEETTPMEEVLDLLHGAPDRDRAAAINRTRLDPPATAEQLHLLRESGIMRREEMIHGLRFAPNSLQFRLPALSQLANC